MKSDTTDTTAAFESMLHTDKGITKERSMHRTEARD
jgi:hypothetical protein